MEPTENNPAEHVAFLLPDLRGGGAERLTIDLLAGFVARGVRVDLVLQRPEGEFLALVPPEVRIVDLEANRVRGVPVPLRRYMRKEAPDVLLAAMWPLTTAAIVAAVGLPTRVVVSDHCALFEQYAGQSRTLTALRASLRMSYRFADGIVAVSGGLADELAALSGLPRERITTINNPVGVPLRSAADPGSLWRTPRGKRLLSVGTLKAQKNHALLIDALALLDDPGIELAIVGEGALRDALVERIEQRGLAGQVKLAGFTPTPGDWYAGADLFVLASDYEGFGNVLVEAMYAGLSVVSTDCRFGPAEVLGQGRWGILVPPCDPAALAEAISAALTAMRNPQTQRARAAEFSVTRAVDAYYALMLPQ